MSKTLRPYQEECIQTVISEYNKGKNRQLVVKATGTGKTFTTCKITENFNRVLWLTHTEELIEQSAESLLGNLYDGNSLELSKFIESNGGIINTLNYIEHSPLLTSSNQVARFIHKNIGIMKAERSDVNQKIIVASVQTIHRRLERIHPESFDLIVVDECHLAMANTWRKTLEYFNPKLTLGLTATPTRLDGMSLSKLFDEITFQYDIIDGIKDGYLAEIDAIRIRTDLDISKVKTTGGDLNAKDLRIVDTIERNNLIVDSYEKYCKGTQGLIFGVDIEHCKNIAETFNRRGYEDVTWISGETPNRKEIIAQFKSGNIRILVNCMILTTGFDYPETGFIGMACPTKSVTKYIQCVGRGTRLKSPDFVNSFGQKMILLDFVDVSSKHRLVNSWSLDDDKDIEDRVFTTKEKKKKLLEEKAKRESKIDRGTKEDVRVDLIKLPVIKVEKSYKMMEDATDKQLAYLERLGYDIVNNFYTKYDASMLITNHEATINQINVLKRLGYDCEKGVTIGQANKVFDDIKKKREAERIEQQINNSSYDIHSNGTPAF